MNDTNNNFTHKDKPKIQKRSKGTCDYLYVRNAINIKCMLAILTLSSHITTEYIKHSNYI